MTSTYAKRLRKGPRAITAAAPRRARAGSPRGAGGLGSAGTSVDGKTPATIDPGPVGGGGGGTGRIRINTITGAATLASATLSPAATTSCLTQGMVKASGG